MTHVLVNPEYSLKHARARTVDDHIALTSQKHSRRKYATENELNHIRSESRIKWLSAWEDPGKVVIKSVYDWESTYSRQHNFKQLDQPIKCRPTSPTRRNNPHPPRVFLRLRVSKDQGHYSRKPVQNPYKGVNNCPLMEDRTMYYTLKDIKRMKRNGQEQLLNNIMNPEESNSTSFKIPRDGTNIRSSLPRKDDSLNTEKVVPSLHRWLKCAGKQEREKMNNLKRNLWVQDSVKFKTVDPNRYLLRKYDPVPQVKIHRPYRREFGIHPQLWVE